MATSTPDARANVDAFRAVWVDASKGRRQGVGPYSYDGVDYVRIGSDVTLTGAARPRTRDLLHLAHRTQFGDQRLQRRDHRLDLIEEDGGPRRPPSFIHGR